MVALKKKRVIHSECVYEGRGHERGDHLGSRHHRKILGIRGRLMGLLKGLQWLSVSGGVKK